MPLRLFSGGITSTLRAISCSENSDRTCEKLSGAFLAISGRSELIWDTTCNPVPSTLFLRWIGLHCWSVFYPCRFLLLSWCIYATKNHKTEVLVWMGILKTPTPIELPFLFPFSESDFYVRPCSWNSNYFPYPPGYDFKSSREFFLNRIARCLYIERLGWEQLRATALFAIKTTVSPTPTRTLYNPPTVLLQFPEIRKSRWCLPCKSVQSLP
jgi:hypothetical protein